ncbi:uncharacterized protein LOC134536360 [Bacillus rossius redtenbacheri]|uniref:uncharacterized protein LOC134536360 n=1 Tax=Bacillus rossius redtenbacheri TaxID=93214 RepID=UPI002FDCC959
MSTPDPVGVYGPRYSELSPGSRLQTSTDSWPAAPAEAPSPGTMSPGAGCLLLLAVLVSTTECRPYSFLDLLFPSQSYNGPRQTRGQASTDYGTRQSYTDYGARQSYTDYGTRQSYTDYGARQPRQTYGSSASQLIDSIFQVPIQTLGSVGQLVKATAELPSLQRRREQRLESRRRPRNRDFLSPAAQTADLPVAADGSSYKI